MKRHNMSGLMALLAGTALAVPMALLGAAPAAGDDGAAPPPENLQVVVDESGTVDRLEWDPPADGSEPAVYEVNYRFANVGPLGEQVFWWTRDTFLESSWTFGHFVECTPGHHPSEEWIVWITYRTADGTSERSNRVSMCFP